MNKPLPRVRLPIHRHFMLSMASAVLLVDASFGPAFAATAMNNAAPQTAATQASVAPNVVPSLPPAYEATQIRYPAYGAEVHGVAEMVPVPGVPQQITLKQAVAIAVATSPTLAAARADVGIAQAQVRLARTGELPSLSGVINANHTTSGGGNNSTVVSSTSTNNANNANNVNSTTTSSTSTSSANVGYQSNTASLSLSQLIYDGGRVAAGIRAAKDSETAAAETYRRALQTLEYNVATAYYAALSAERTTQVDVELVRENQQQLQLVNAQFHAGVAARVDAITAELPVAQAQVAVIQAQGAQVSALATFANTLGIAANAAVQPVDDAPVLSSTLADTPGYNFSNLTFTTAMVRARALRPDLASSLASLHASEQSLKQARLGLFPTLSAGASTGVNSTSLGGGDYAHSTSVGASLAIPLFDQGATSANVAVARANLEVAQANYRSTDLAVSLAVRQGFAQLVSAQAALRATAVELTEATAILQSTQAQYRAGVTTLPQLLNAQVGLSQALVTQVNAVYALQQAQQTFIYALGEDVLAS